MAVLDDRVLIDDLQRRGIHLVTKDFRYRVADNTTGFMFAKARNEFSDLLDKYAREYEEEFWDCDDFAILFKAICGLCGIAAAYAEGRVFVDGWFLGYHAFNLVPWYSKEVNKLIWLVVEPQLVGTGYQWFAVLPEESMTVKMNIYTYEVVWAWM